MGHFKSFLPGKKNKGTCLGSFFLTASDAEHFRGEMYKYSDPFPVHPFGWTSRKFHFAIDFSHLTWQNSCGS